MTHHELPFKASFLVGLGDNGELILGDSDSNEYLFKMQHNGKKYIETWKKRLPDEMAYNCCKGISSDQYIFLQRSKDEKTVCYDKSLTKTTELNLQGELIDSISDEVFYAQETRFQSDWLIVHKTVMEGKSTSSDLASALQNLQLVQHKTLRPPSPHGWNSCLFVCRMKFSYVVVTHITRSMDIFDEDGRKHYSLKLYYITEISVRK